MDWIWKGQGSILNGAREAEISKETVDQDANQDRVQTTDIQETDVLVLDLQEMTEDVISEMKGEMTEDVISEMKGEMTEDVMTEMKGEITEDGMTVMKGEIHLAIVLVTVVKSMTTEVVMNMNGETSEDTFRNDSPTAQTCSYPSLIRLRR